MEPFRSLGSLLTQKILQEFLQKSAATKIQKSAVLEATVKRCLMESISINIIKLNKTFTLNTITCIYLPVSIYSASPKIGNFFMKFRTANCFWTKTFFICACMSPNFRINHKNYTMNTVDKSDK